MEIRFLVSKKPDLTELNLFLAICAALLTLRRNRLEIKIPAVLYERGHSFCYDVKLHQVNKKA